METVEKELRFKKDFLEKHEKDLKYVGDVIDGICARGDVESFHQFLGGVQLLFHLYWSEFAAEVQMREKPN